MIEFQFYFEVLIKRNRIEITFQELVSKTMIKDSWASEANIVAVAILLKKPIWVFNKCFSGNLNVIHKFTIETNSLQPITIGLSDFHFFPILFKENEIQITKQSLDFNFLGQMPNIEYLYDGDLI